MIKKTRLKTFFIALLFAAGLTAGADKAAQAADLNSEKTSVTTSASTSNATQTVNDDPGAGRLSGDSIPEEFYEETSPLLRFFGGSSFTTKSPYTSKTYTHKAAFSDREILHGIDVSVWQGNIDWTKVKADGIDYAFIRVGYRGYGSAGTLSEATIDTKYTTNMENAIAAGIRVGVYIFSQAITVKEAQEEAQYILEHLEGYDVSMPLIMDYEYASDSSTGGRLKTAKLSKDKATKICMAFCETIADAGYTPMVYANKSMLEDQLNASTISAKYPIWLANYTTNTAYSGDFTFWQYASTGKVNGISGNVDMNFYYSSATDNFAPDKPSIGTAIVSDVPDQTYTGESFTPAVTVTYLDRTLEENVDYTLTYSDNKSVGTATILLKGIGEFCGVKKVTFAINPSTVTGLKAKKKSTSYITLSWSKNTSGSGYEIYRSTSQNGSYSKIATISKNTTVTYKNTKLAAGQCYYYKIRSFKKSGDETYYGEFSSVSALYTKMGYTRNAYAKKATSIYSATDTSSETLIKLAKKNTMSVTYSTKDEKGNSWYYVSYKKNGVTYKGYVLSSAVTITKVGKVVKASKVNVRKTKSVKGKVLTTLKKNKTVTVLSTKKKKGVTWYKVTFKKSKKTYTGWICAPYIKIQ
jgi:GH25 family lysozyme M1 (1,4-beta-N-acetylmuramidase)/fibronectin type 3 domain-containing protein